MTTPASEETDPHADTANSRKATDTFVLSIGEFLQAFHNVLCSNPLYLGAKYRKF